PTNLDLGIVAISCLQCSAPGLSSPDTERTLLAANQPRAHRSPRNINSICTVLFFLSLLWRGRGASFTLGRRRGKHSSYAGVVNLMIALSRSKRGSLPCFQWQISPPVW
ncbi:unnamed protein product, partial [Bubo scandiacus]